MTPFRFTVVIPTYQRREVVLASVRALRSQESSEPFEVVVVVDGSTDGTAAALQRLELPFPLTVIVFVASAAAAAPPWGRRTATSAAAITSSTRPASPSRRRLN